MNNRALTLSLLMAVIAVWFVYEYVNGIEMQTQKKFGTEVMVIKAKRDIKEMETINETMLEFDPIPKKFLEPSAVFSEDREEKSESQHSTMKSMVGMVAVVPIKKGEQVAYNKMIEPSMR